MEHLQVIEAQVRSVSCLHAHGHGLPSHGSLPLVQRRRGSNLGVREALLVLQGASIPGREAAREIGTGPDRLARNHTYDVGPRRALGRSLQGVGGAVEAGGEKHERSASEHDPEQGQDEARRVEGGTAQETSDGGHGSTSLAAEAADDGQA